MKWLLAMIMPGGVTAPGNRKRELKVIRTTTYSNAHDPNK